MSLEFDLSELKKYRDELNRLNKSQLNDVLLQAIYEIVQREYRLVLKQTPVDSGELRRGWFIKDIVVKDDGVEAYIKNDVDYADYVEYGHRTRDGKGFVDGFFMLTISEQKIKKVMDRIVQRHLEEAFRKL